MHMNPRTARGLAALGLAALLSASYARAQGAVGVDPWTRLPGILAGIKAPVFPARDFLITNFGARPDGVTDATDAFKNARAPEAGEWWCPRATF
jgi:hypothetical protein